MATAARLLLTLSGEIHTKSRRTRPWFRHILRRNLQAALARHAPDARLSEHGQRLVIEPASDAAAEAASRVFGIRRVSRVETLPGGDLQRVIETVAAAARPRVEGRTFAVRVRRRSDQPWRSPDVEREIGTRLLDATRGVDLDRPEVTVAVEAYADATYLVADTLEGAGGVPLGTQDRVLALLSGGFDSPVAAWMLMRRGAPADFLHVQLECAQADHALAVARELWSRWGAGTHPVAWLIDFSQVRQALLDSVDSRLRQVVLKQLMLAAADVVAERAGIPALVTGESVGQVSSQTLRHLAAIDAACSHTVLRPLAGMDKEEIIALSRRVGTHDLSARAKEVCDLSVGPVAVGAPAEEIDAARAGVPAGLVEAAVAAPQVVALDAWVPGMPAVPVVDRAPDGVPLVTGGNGMPPVGPVAVAGRHAAALATRLRAASRDVWVVQPGAGREPEKTLS